MLPEQEEEAGGRVTTEKDTPRRLASSSQGEDRGEVGLLGEEVPRTPAHTHVHTCAHTHTPAHTQMPGHPFSRVQAGAMRERETMYVCVCDPNTSMHTCTSTHRYMDALTLESRLVP